MIRRQLILDLGGFNETLSNAHDWDMWLRLAAQVPFVYVPEVHTLYRQLPQSMRKNEVGMSQSRLRIFQMMRDMPRRQDCLDDAAYDRFMAGRYHILGLVYWRAQRRADARAALRTAIQLAPEAARLRRLYVGLSYLFPFEITQVIRRLRGR